MPKDRWADLDSEKTVNALVEAVRSGGYEAEFWRGCYYPGYDPPI